MNRLKRVVYATVLLMLGDAVTTAIALQRGFIEMNPLFAGSPWAAVVANVAVATLLYVVMKKWGHRLELGVVDHVIAVLYIVATIKAIAVLNNTLVLIGVREWVFTIPPAVMYVIMAIGATGIAIVVADAIWKIRVK